MITKPLKGVAAEFDKIKFPVLATPKLDGIRALKIDDKLLSNRFKPIPNKHVTNVVLSSGIPNGMDGELMVPGTFQNVTSAIMSRDGEPEFTYNLFDWVSDSLTTPYHKRVRSLIDLGLEFPWVKIVKPVLIRTLDDLEEYEAKQLELGYEGVMIRTPDSPYKCGRSSVREGYLLKLKRFIDSEGIIIDCFQKMKNTNEQERNELGYAKRSSNKEGLVPVDTLGGFTVRDIKELKDVEFNVGSGLTDAIRAEVWKDPKSYIGKIITYKFQPCGIKEKPRQPVFKGFRHPDDLSLD